MKIAAVIPTYYRPDGKTSFYLMRALDSVRAQTHTDYEVYVIGDNYADKIEFEQLEMKYPWVNFMNLLYAKERDKYRFKSMELWCAGGVYASNIGITWALNEGFEYVCLLGHDDWWEPDHLQRINEILEAKKSFFVCTVSTWMDSALPNPFRFTKYMTEFYPQPSGLICASACVKFSDTKLRPRDVFAETGKAEPADADLWKRLAKEMKAEGKKGYLINTLTCHHEEEGYSLHGVAHTKR
jgi:glycosyltransferase involved in cell wall biosynthesis